MQPRSTPPQQEFDVSIASGLNFGRTNKINAEQTFNSMPEQPAGRFYLRQYLCRNIEQFQQFAVPFAGADVEQHGAGRIGRIGQVSASEVEQQPRVNRAETDFPSERTIL